MAHYFIFPEKDTTIYSHPLKDEANAGIDEVLTILDEEYLGGYYPSRILIKFKDSNIQDVVDNKISGPFSASLNLYATEHVNLNSDQVIEVYPLGEDWNNGTGRIDNTPFTTDGCSWKFRDNDTLQTSWTLSGHDESQLDVEFTGSLGGENQGGGIWYYGDGFEVTRSYSFQDELDLNFDVTSPVLKFYSGSKLGSSYPNGIPNNGFIIKRTGSREFNSNLDGTLNFFSLDTHTIYPPYLDFSWDDSVYDTGSATDDKVKTTGECYVTLRNNKEKYNQIEEVKFRLNVRELYPTRKFVTSSNFLDVNYFTSESFYSLVDYATDETIIPFGDHSKLSADAEGMHFKIFMNGLQAGRYYKLLFKHENNDGIRVYDDNYYFKVVNNH
tara:strand:+ start:782 stop:1933 length:1152 start_codon:yes stop_codon:yes gene_type:complete